MIGTDTFNNATGPRLYARRLRFRHLLYGAGGLLWAALQAATQFFAYRFGYQDVLGFEVNHVYPPWAIALWWRAWYSTYSLEFQRAVALGVFVVVFGVAVGGAALSVWSGGSARFIHGSARWANQRDLEKANLLPRSRRAARKTPPGIYLAQWVGPDGQVHALRHHGSQHVMCTGPTRCGKGLGVVVPNLVSWVGSAFVLDLKDELYWLTAGWRGQYANNEILRFEPAGATGTLQWNPLDEIQLGDKEVGQVQTFASVFIHPNPEEVRNNHWKVTAKMLLDALILHVLYRREREHTEANLGEIARLLSDPALPSAELWEQMLHYQHLPDGTTHPLVAAGAKDMIERPEEERGSVYSTLVSKLELWRDPVLSRNTSRSDFSLRDLMHCDRPRTLYIVTKPADEERMRPMLRTLLHLKTVQLMNELEFEKNGLPRPAYKHPLWNFYDELPYFGELVFLPRVMAVSAGFGISFLLLMQDPKQLREVYGPSNPIAANVHVVIAYPPNDLETAEHYSSLLGTTTEMVPSVSVSVTDGKVTRSRSVQPMPRRLRDAYEVKGLRQPERSEDGKLITAPGDVLVFVTGTPGIHGQQIVYPLVPALAARVGLPVPPLPKRVSAPRIAA